MIYRDFPYKTDRVYEQLHFLKGVRFGVRGVTVRSHSPLKSN